MMCDANNLKVDAPKLFATWILSKPKFLKKYTDVHMCAESMRTEAAKLATILSSHKRRFGISPCPDNPNVTSYPTFKIRRMATTKPKRPSKNRIPLTPSNEFLYGIRIPRTVEDTIRLDRVNGNTLWQDAICKDLGTIWGMKMFSLVAQQDRNDITKSLQFACPTSNHLYSKAISLMESPTSHWWTDAKDHELYAKTMKGRPYDYCCS
jgi:hypothetical protein